MRMLCICSPFLLLCSSTMLQNTRFTVRLVCLISLRRNTCFCAHGRFPAFLLTGVRKDASLNSRLFQCQCMRTGSVEIHSLENHSSMSLLKPHLHITPHTSALEWSFATISRTCVKTFTNAFRTFHRHRRGFAMNGKRGCRHTKPTNFLFFCFPPILSFLPVSATDFCCKISHYNRHYDHQ